MYVVGEQVKIDGNGLAIIEVINKKTVEVWSSKGRGIKISKDKIRKED